MGGDPRALSLLPRFASVPSTDIPSLTEPGPQGHLCAQGGLQPPDRRAILGLSGEGGTPGQRSGHLPGPGHRASAGDSSSSNQASQKPGPHFQMLRGIRTEASLQHQMDWLWRLWDSANSHGSLLATSGAHFPAVSHLPQGGLAECGQADRAPNQPGRRAWYHSYPCVLPSRYEGMRGKELPPTALWERPDHPTSPPSNCLHLMLCSCQPPAHGGLRGSPNRLAVQPPQILDVSRQKGLGSNGGGTARLQVLWGQLPRSGGPLRTPTAACTYATS